MLPKIWFNVSQTQAEGHFQLDIGIRQDVSFTIFGTLDELDEYADQIKQEIAGERMMQAEFAAEYNAQLKNFEQCEACEDGIINDHLHTCAQGENGGWGPSR